MNALKTATVGTLLFGAIATSALATAGPASAQSHDTSAATQAVAYRAGVPDVGSPSEAAGNQDVAAIGPDGTRVYSTKQLAAPPSTSTGRGEAKAAAAGPWRYAISEAGGVRIRKSTPSGTVLGTMPLYARLWVSCKKGPANNQWFWVAYNPGNRWIYGWSSAPLIEIDPDAYIPYC